MSSVSIDRRFGVNSGLPFKAPVFVATTANITLSGEQTIDGQLTNESRVLVKNQTDTTANGLYDTSTSAWTRCIDANGNRDLVKGTAVYVTDGSTQAGAFYSVTTANPVVIGTSSIVWALSVAAGSLATQLADTASVGLGDALVGVKSVATGAEVRTQHDKNADTMSTADFDGIDTTGATDSAVGLQAAITATRSQGGDKRTLHWKKGTYKVNSGLILGSNQHIVFEPGVAIDATGLPNETTSLFTAANQVGVYLEGNGATLTGARATAVIEGTSAGIYLYGSDNILVRDFNIVDFATDGITVSGDNAASGPCTNVRIEGCDCYNNRRNGLSIIHAKGVEVVGGRYRSSNGAPSGPWAGIDVEPNANNVCQDIVIEGVRTDSNVGGGLLFVPGNQSLALGTTFTVTVNGGTSDSDGSTAGVPALRFANGGAFTNLVYGKVVVRDFAIINPLSRGASFSNWDAALAPQVVLENVTVLNPDATSNAATNEDRSGIVVYTTSAEAVTYNGNIRIVNCRVSDARGSPRMVYPILLQSDSAKGVQNVVVIDPKGENFTAAQKVDVITNTSGASLLDQCDVVYSTPRSVSLTTSQNVDLFGGKRVKFNANTMTLTMPAALNCPGMKWEFEVGAGVTGATIARGSTDLFKFAGTTSSTVIALVAGDVACLRSLGGALWSGSYGS